ncbi:MAG: hypothetical protein M1272_05565 [Firmicutes bacterium]|nr:hypothetical protein [Bacillota bacterium]
MRRPAQPIGAPAQGFVTLDGTALTVQTTVIDNPYLDPALQGQVYDLVNFNWHFRVAMQKPSVLSQSVLKFLLKLGDIESSIKAAIRDTLTEANIPWDSMPRNLFGRPNEKPSLQIYAPPSGSAHFWVNWFLNGLTSHEEALDYLNRATLTVGLLGFLQLEPLPPS